MDRFQIARRIERALTPASIALVIVVLLAHGVAWLGAAL